VKKIKLLKSKKAYEKSLLGGNIIFYAAVIIIIVIQAALFGFTSANYYIVNTKAPESFQKELRMTRPAVSHECFAFQDKNTQRVYPYYIDAERFNNDNFDNCFNTQLNCYEAELYNLNRDAYYKSDIRSIDWTLFQNLHARVTTDDFDECKKQNTEIEVEDFSVKIVDKGQITDGILKIKLYS